MIADVMTGGRLFPTAATTWEDSVGPSLVQEVPANAVTSNATRTGSQADRETDIEVFTIRFVTLEETRRQAMGTAFCPHSLFVFISLLLRLSRVDGPN
jgi:hypothetical protein